MHLPSHNPICYKYNIRKSKVCKFDFPQPSLPNSEIDMNGTIGLKWDNVWVNPWNLAIASLIRSNHDINFIPSSIKALALIYYITNYATKGDCSQYQRVMVVAIVRKVFDNHDNNITVDKQGLVRGLVREWINYCMMIDCLSFYVAEVEHY